MKLGEVGLHDPQAGVGKIDDVDVVVGDAAKLVGKKVTGPRHRAHRRPRLGRAATPAEEVDEPLTAEGEAERPTRVEACRAEEEGRGVETEVETEDASAEVDDEVDERGGRGRGESRSDGDDPAARRRSGHAADRAGVATARRRLRPRRGTGGPPHREQVSDTEREVSDTSREVSDTPSSRAAPAPGDPPAGPRARPTRTATATDAPRRSGRGAARAVAGTAARRRRRPAARRPPRAPTTVRGRRQSRAAPEAERRAAAPKEPSENGDWGYTPMSQWGMDDDAALAATLPAARGLPPAIFSVMDYAIIRLGGKQYRVREGETLVVDRLKADEGKTFTPGRAARRRRDGDREGARARARPEDPDRQVQEAHRLQAPQRVPRRDVAHRDLARRREEGAPAKKTAEAPKARPRPSSAEGRRSRRPPRITSRACRAATRR